MKKEEILAACFIFAIIIMSVMCLKYMYPGRTHSEAAEDAGIVICSEAAGTDRDDAVYIVCGSSGGTVSYGYNGEAELRIDDMYRVKSCKNMHMHIYGRCIYIQNRVR